MCDLQRATVNSVKRLNVETPHPDTCLQSPKIANNVPPSSGKHSANSDSEGQTLGGEPLVATSGLRAAHGHVAAYVVTG